MTLWVKGTDGTATALPRLLELEVVWGMDSPAHSLEAACLWQGDPLPPLVEVELHRGSEVLFRGFCDQQKEQSSPQGRRLTLSARSRGSLLLDNEAKPQTYFRADTRDIFRAHVLPYGLTRLEVPRVLSAGMFQVAKGRSEWEVFSAFCMRMYARWPWVDAGDGLRVAAPDRHPRGLISNRPEAPAALRFHSLTRTLRRASVVHPIILRDREGNYGSAMDTPLGHLNIRRRRYIIPAAEYATTPTADAYQKLNRSCLGFYSLETVLPGETALQLGEAVAVDDPLCGRRVLTVYQKVLRRDFGGVQTRLTLVDPDFL